jgi:hypothetical protein
LPAHKKKSININFTTINIMMILPAGVRQQEGLDEAVYRHWEESWVQLAMKAVSKDLFDDVQFITGDEQECFGSEWQQEVCEKATVNYYGKAYAEAFWNRKGRVLARKALNRRRQNTNTAMKRIFLGKT